MMRLQQLGRLRYWQGQELRSRDPEALIEKVAKVKLASHPNDQRVVLICGTLDGKLRVEWCEECNFAAGSREARKKMAFQAKMGLLRPIGNERSTGRPPGPPAFAARKGAFWKRN